MCAPKWRNFIMRSGTRQVSINLTGGVSSTIVCSLHKQGVANVLNLNPRNQHYTAFLVIGNEANSYQCANQGGVCSYYEDECSLR